MSADLDKLVDRAAKGDVLDTYLLVGESEQILRDAGHRLAHAIVPEADRSFNLTRYDGSTTRPAEIADDLCSLSLMGGRRVVLVLGATFLASKQDRSALVHDLVDKWEAGREQQSLDRAVALLSEAGIGPGDLIGNSKKAAEAFGKSLGLAVAKGDRVDRWRLALGSALDEAGRDIPPASGGVSFLDSVLTDGRAAGNTLIVTARKADRTMPLVKTLRARGAGVNLDTRIGRDSDRAAAAMFDQIVGELGARLAPDARALVLERLVPDRERITREVEKLVAFAGEGGTIDRAAADALVGRDREDPIWELTAAIGQRDLTVTLRRLGQLLERSRDAGGETIRLTSSIAGEVRRLIRARVLIDGPLRGRMGARTSDRDFQRTIFPELATLEGAGPLASGHHFRAYQTFLAAGRFSLRELVALLRALAALDRTLKSKPTDPRLALERVLVSHVPRSRRGRAA